MEADDIDQPIASTVIDLFDKHKRLRQGTWNLQLHLDKFADKSLACETPGLTAHKTTVEINNKLKQIQKWRKRGQSKATWLDK